MNSQRPPSSGMLPCGRPFSKISGSQVPSQGLLREMTQKLEAFVFEKKLNRSEARTKILEVMFGERLHFRAQDLVKKVQKRHPDIGRSTVYRNLPILVECGLIQEGPTDSEGQTLYELSGEAHHDHIVCTDCQKIFEFHDDSIEKRQEVVSGRLGFAPTAHRHVIYGTCEYLRKNLANR